mgnify:CR=1 FL=1
MFSNIDEDMRKMKTPPPVSSHKFQGNLLDGLLENGQSVKVVNIPRVRYFPKYQKILFRRKLFVWKNKTIGEYIAFINLPVLNYVSQKKTLTRALENYVKEAGNERCVLICFNNYLPQNQAMLKVRKKYNNNVVLCGVLGDIHGQYGVQVAKRYDGLRGRIVRYIEKKQDDLSSQFDSFGFVTKYMAEALGVEKKPHVIIEGIYSEDGRRTRHINDGKTKTVFYAGAVEKEYGLIHLLNAFSLIKDENYRLVIAGGGGAVDEILNRAKHDSRISYLGYITPKEVEKHQQNATVLVNPRLSNHEYVKYSFASKNMECLASGKPYIAYKLPCNPPEYDGYIQYPKGETEEWLAEKIEEVCNYPEEKRAFIGLKAREFILNEKNPKSMCKRIVEMSKNIGEDDKC